ncbi:hypothetical protein [Parazoarcus communis]|uniref:hypothetical protein n=1 Tax=Parazoarcus communis TaxID=41977 RepID=UPI00105811F5|nr:hypothetical protein [Parazoarcus communis]NMG71854.1 hypothetical protein [Parazoarcus communis SWub3 = DSM 12120]
MANTPADLLKFAERIIETGFNDEIVNRTAVSRSYYAVYHTALGLADSLTLPPADPNAKGSHSRLYSQLISCETTHSSEYMKIRQIGYMARGVLKPYRVHADYELNKDLSGEKCSEAIAKARLLLDKAKHFIS